MGNGFCINKTYHKTNTNPNNINNNKQIIEIKDGLEEIKNKLIKTNEELTTIKDTVIESKNNFDSKFPIEKKNTRCGMF